MNDEDKINLLVEVLEKDYKTIGLMDRAELKDFVECISIFINTKDNIVAEGAIKTMYLIANKH
ncbi:hypothetical protein ACQCU1_18795 [Sutcliffiella horikoshii]|uniref:hypothetical protein n=1 Tax=Sutcliffiella horikoshii TaxID=79883 RepID=UPI003CED2301